MQTGEGGPQVRARRAAAAPASVCLTPVLVSVCGILPPVVQNSAPRRLRHPSEFTQMTPRVHRGRLCSQISALCSLSCCLQYLRTAGRICGLAQRARLWICSHAAQTQKHPSCFALVLLSRKERLGKNTAAFSTPATFRPSSALPHLPLVAPCSLIYAALMQSCTHTQQI